MPTAIFEFAYKAAEPSDASAAILERIQKALDQVSKADLRQEVVKKEGHPIAVSDIDPLDGVAGLRVEIAMDEPPRRADTVKEIIEELEKIQRRVGLYFDYQIVSEFADENWDRTHNISTSALLVATRGFKVGAARKRSWWFPIGFALGCAVTYYALNFALVNQQVAALIASFR